MNKEELRTRVVWSLRHQGFSVRKDRIVFARGMDKDAVRAAHTTAVKHRLHEAEPALREKETSLIQRIANGSDITLEDIKPCLVAVEPGTVESDLFRWASLHWSIPVSTGYGRRLRFLVMDESNDKLIGILGLADPVFGLQARDDWIGWDRSVRQQKLRHVMDAFVLGAVPPYSRLLCGKLVAMFVASREVRRAFRRKYGGSQNIISGETFDGSLALVTTTSALGRSSLYNRLKFEDKTLYCSVGFTRGSGDFHFSNGLYHDIFTYVSRWCEPTAKHSKWGKGFRNRREVIRKCLQKIGLSNAYAWHGIQREVFVVPLAENARAYLNGRYARLRYYNWSANDLFEYFRERWLLPRAERDPSYLDFHREEYRLWK